MSTSRMSCCSRLRRLTLGAASVITLATVRDRARELLHAGEPLVNMSLMTYSCMLANAGQAARMASRASRPMPVIGRRCHELRIPDADATWRLMYRTDADAIVIADVFDKKTSATQMNTPRFP